MKVPKKKPSAVDKFCKGMAQDFKAELEKKVGGKILWAPIQTTPSAEVQEDPVNSPKHYVRGGIEVIEVLEKKMSPEAFKGFLMGNVLKYVLRHEYKGGTEDLKKARFYLERMIGLNGP